MANQVSEMVTAIYVADLERSKNFYCDLLGLVPIFESDWVIQLSSAANQSLNLTLQPRNNELIPQDFQKPPQGMSIAFVVPDSDAIFSTSLEMGLEIIKEPTNEVYGQRRFLTVDPDGLLIDVSSDCEPSPEFVEQYMSGE
ncbi:MAG: VOC family protein [bacterium]